MAIAFECPHCRRPFKVADALAGRKAKCAGCGETIAIPLPRSPAKPARPKPPAPDLDVYGLADAVGSTTATETGRDDLDSSSSTGGSLPKMGDRVGQLTVRESSPARLALANSPGRILLLLLSGVAAIAAGIALAAGLEAWLLAARPARVLVLLILGPFALVGYGVGTFCYLARLGYQMVFDRASRSLSIRRFGFWDSTWTAAELGGVVFCVAKLKNEQCGDECPQTAEGFVVDRGGNAVALLERISTKRAGDAGRLADLCLHAGRLLGLPVSVELRGEPRRAELKRAVERIRNESSRRPASALPRVRPPVFTIHTVAAALGGIVVLVGGGRFMLRYTAFGDAAAFVVDEVAPEQRGLLNMVQGDAPAQVQEAGQVQAPEAPPVPPSDIEKFLGELRSPNPTTRSFAASGLEHREPVADHREAVCETLRAMLASNVDSDRRAAMKALNAWGTDDDVPLFIKEMTGPFPGAAEEATVILARRKDPRGAEAMAQLLHEEDRRFTMAVRLGEIGAPAIPFVLPLLDDPDDEVKREAVGILARIGTRAEVPAMEAALNRYLGVVNDPRMRDARPFTPEADRRRKLESAIFFLRAAIPQAAARS